MAALQGKAGMTSPVRRKQMIILACLIGVIAIIALGAGMLGTPKKAPPPRAPESTRKAFGAVGEQVNNADIWRTQEGARVSQLQQQLQEVQARLAAKEKADKDAQIREQEQQARREAEEKRLSQLESERQRVEAEQKASNAPPPNGLPLQNASLGTPNSPHHHPSAPAVVIKGIMRVDMGAGSANSANGKTTVAKAAVAAGGNAAAGAEQNAETYIPAGTFMRGVLLSGLDAPTGGQSQQNPHPVIIEVLDLASLPNKFKADYKSCRLTANGAGDLSSERAYIRLDRMSCITEDGAAVDIAVKGYIADQTGKAGIRGRLVTKQGQVLANSLVAGVASGIGTAFTESAVTSSVSPLGATQTVEAGKELQAGIGRGVGSALERLSKYYIDLAEKMFPIIEIDAGQPVDIVITKGVAIAQK